MFFVVNIRADQTPGVQTDLARNVPNSSARAKLRSVQMQMHTSAWCAHANANKLDFASPGLLYIGLISYKLLMPVSSSRCFLRSYETYRGHLFAIINPIELSAVLTSNKLGMKNCSN